MMKLLTVLCCFFVKLFNELNALWINISFVNSI